MQIDVQTVGGAHVAVARNDRGQVVRAGNGEVAACRLAARALHREFPLAWGARERALRSCYDRLWDGATHVLHGLLALGVACRPGTPVPKMLDRLSREIEAQRVLIERRTAAGEVGEHGKRYAVVLADPPWSYDDRGTRLHPAYRGSQRAEARYPTLPDGEIEQLLEGQPLELADDALLFLWCTDAVITEGRHARVARAWGFGARVTIPWLKVSSEGAPRIGGGHYTRHCTESIVAATRGDLDLSYEGDRLVLATRGHAASRVVADRSVQGVVIAPRGAHSAKPAEARALIEQLVGDAGPKIELFARGRAPGWEAWGNEVGFGARLDPEGNRVPSPDATPMPKLTAQPGRPKREVGQ